jgi:hypothetical protein
MHKTTIIAPLFERDEVHIARSLRSQGFEVKIVTYDEKSYQRRHILLRLASKGFSALGFTNFAIRTSWETAKFMNMVYSCALDTDFLLLVKPNMYRPGYIDSLIKFKCKIILFYLYDTLNSYPCNTNILKLKSNVFSFDFFDCLRFGFSYCPVPRNFAEESVEPSLTRSNKGLYFYGQYSFFRLKRLIVLNFIAKIFNFKTVFYLKNSNCKNLTKIFDVYIGPSRRQPPLTTLIPLDVPQTSQIGATIRSSNSTNDLVISYTLVTPSWRKLNYSSCLSTILTSIELFRLLCSSASIALRLEEKGASSKAFVTTILTKYS